MSEHTLKLILDEKPQLLVISGPSLYLEKFKVETKHIEVGITR